MPLQKINQSGARSTDGYQIQLTRHTLDYQEEENFLLKIEVEYMLEPFSVEVYASRIDAWANPAGIKVDNTKKQQIINRVSEFLELLKEPYKIL